MVFGGAQRPSTVSPRVQILAGMRALELQRASWPASAAGTPWSGSRTAGSGNTRHGRRNAERPVSVIGSRTADRRRGRGHGKTVEWLNDQRQQERRATWYMEIVCNFFSCLVCFSSQSEYVRLHPLQSLLFLMMFACNVLIFGFVAYCVHLIS